MPSACWRAPIVPPPSGCSQRDSKFAAMVTDWEQRLAPWAGEIAEVAAPPQVWERIAAALPAPAAPSAGLWQNLVFWRGLTLATGALAAACLGALIYLGTLDRQPPLVATHRRRRPPSFRRHRGRQARHYRGGAGGIQR